MLSDTKTESIANLKYVKHQSEEWEYLAENGWRTYEVYEDGVCLMLFQKYLH